MAKLTKIERAAAQLMLPPGIKSVFFQGRAYTYQEILDLKDRLNKEKSRLKVPKKISNYSETSITTTQSEPKPSNFTQELG